MPRTTPGPGRSARLRRRGSRNTKVAEALSCVVFSLIMLSGACFAQSIQEQRLTGRDPSGFDQASGMYRGEETKPFDAEAKKQLALLGDKLREYHALECDSGWRGLQALNPYRLTPEVERALPKWLALCLDRARDTEKPPAQELLDEGNDCYRKGDFEGASTAYLELLWQSPKSLDARNNLALAQVHLGQDLAARAELELLRQLAPQYLPALVNLTVVYERAGWRDKAREMARKAVALQANVPPSAYNEAWYLEQEARPGEAEELLRPLVSRPDPARKHVQLHEIVLREQGKFGPWWRIGAAAKLGAKANPRAMQIAVAVFAVLSLLVISLGTSVGRAGIDDKAAAFWTAAIVAGVVCFVSWGQPAGWWWAALAGYALACGSWSSARV